MARGLVEADDPKELVPGEPGLVWEMADSFGTLGRAFEDVGRAFRGIDDGGWRGAAADAFRARVESQPRRFLLAADAFVSAAVALDAYASALNWAQRQAGEAIALVRGGEPGEVVVDRGEPSLTVVQQAELVGVVGVVPEAAPVPSGGSRSAAVDMLGRALDQLDRIGRDAAGKVREAGALAPGGVRVLGAVLPSAGPVVRGRGSVRKLVVPELVSVVVDAAVQHPDGQFKQQLDHSTLRDRPDVWEAGVAELRTRLRRLGLAQLSPRLKQHIFEGHAKRRKRGGGYRELGYHHREGGVDRGAMRVVRVVAGPDDNGVYRARVAGSRARSRAEVRVSTFFPDSWARDDVLRAVRFAFLNRVCSAVDDSGVPRRWRGWARGLLIEGYVESQVGDARSAQLYHIVTAYPIYQGGSGCGQGN